MRTRIVYIFLIVCFVLLFESCWTTVNLGKLRNDILNIDPNIEKVGFIPNSTESDDKYISIDIIFSDERRLYLVLVNYANMRTPDECFYLSRIGNYSFGLFTNHLDENGDVKQFSREYNGKIEEWYERTQVKNYIPMAVITEKLGIKFSGNKGNKENLKILISNYDNILSYVESLPEYNESFGDVFFDSLHLFTPISPRYNWPKYDWVGDSVYDIITRINWDDEYYHWDNTRPDYEITESYTVIK